MKTNRTQPKGTALLVSVVVLGATLMVATGALLQFSMDGYRKACNRTKRIRMLYTAEAGCQYALAYFNIYSKAYEEHPGPVDFSNIVLQFCQIATSMFITNIVANDMNLVKFEVTGGAIYKTNGYAVGESIFPGMRASVKPITVKVGIEQRSDTNNYVEVNQIIESRSYSIFEYGVFTDCNTRLLTDMGMTIQGAVHCNGVLSLGQEGGQDLVIEDFVTCASDIFCITAGNSVKIHNAVDVEKAMTDAFGNKLDSSHPFWKTQALSIWGGRVKSWVHGIPVLKLPIPFVGDNPRILIDPPATNDNSAVSSARYANKAAIRIMNNVVEKWNGSAYVPVTTVSAIPGVIHTNRIWDNRLNRFVNMYNVNVANLEAWIKANVNNPFYTDAIKGGTIYMFSTNKHTAYKLYNGASIPTPVISGTSNGFTVVSGIPIYIQGDYNKTTLAPAATMADAVTILSAKWDDGAHQVSNSPATKVANTAYYTAIIAGQCTNNNIGTGDKFYGGIEDLPGYLEDWQGTGESDNKTIQGTIASFFSSLYQAEQDLDPDLSPNRIWRFNPDFAYPIQAPRFYEFVPTRWVRRIR